MWDAARGGRGGARGRVGGTDAVGGPGLPSCWLVFFSLVPVFFWCLVKHCCSLPILS